MANKVTKVNQGTEAQVYSPTGATTTGYQLQTGSPTGMGTTGTAVSTGTAVARPPVTIGPNGKMQTPYTGLQGLSAATQSGMRQSQEAYTPGQRVTQAQSYLDDILGKKPGDYSSKYTQQLNDIYDQIMNRGAFKYDLNADMLYQNYADQYQQLGKQAMQDTIGQASAMTGGYGNSYAASAGNQAYQQYLTQLNSMIPELYDRAYQRYQDEGNELYNRYGLAQGADATDYGRYLDMLGQWNNDRSFAQDAYQQEYQNDYGRYADDRSYWTQLANLENGDYWNQQNYDQAQQQFDATMQQNQDQFLLQLQNGNKQTQQQQAYNTVLTMLQNGKRPSAQLLQLAGLTAEDVTAWLGEDKPTTTVSTRPPATVETTAPTTTTTTPVKPTTTQTTTTTEPVTWTLGNPTTRPPKKPLMEYTA